jgi:hypothetical protein
MAKQLGDREVFLCLSGGLDSSLICALAVKNFDRVNAFTYSYVADGHPESEDATYARRVADHLEIPLHFVPATREDIIGALDDALAYGQDWRDFNVHCAVVNELLARAMSQHPGNRLVLTGDQMNEIVADYTPISYAGREYYKLPKMTFDQLRAILIRGLDTGDREVGVFHRHGLDLIQAYGLVASEYCRVPSSILDCAEGKQHLVKAIGADLLPEFVFGRTKVRAQIGTSGKPTGILPILVDSGRDSAYFKQACQRLFRVDDVRKLNLFIRAGLYRVAPAFPGKVRDGYRCD